VGGVWSWRGLGHGEVVARNLPNSSPRHGRYNCHFLSTSEDEGTRVTDQLGIHAPSTPLQHGIDPSVRVLRHDELCEISELQPVVGEGERFGGTLGSSHGCCEVENSYLAHLESWRVGGQVGSEESRDTSHELVLSRISMTSRKWAPSFLDENSGSTSSKKSALVILNQPFSLGLLWKLWKASSWKACADGGANRLYDLFSGELQGLRIR